MSTDLNSKIREEDEDTTAGGGVHSKLAEVEQGFASLNIGTALQRALALYSFRVIQDIVCRVTIFAVLLGGSVSGRHVAAVLLLIVFCAMWQISRTRLMDAVSQIEAGFVIGAQKIRQTPDLAQWEHFLTVLGSRATSRRDIAFFEAFLQFEPLVWAVVGIVVIFAS